MAFLHCHGILEDGTACGWGQDDFWEHDRLFNGKVREGYTPLRSDLMKDNIEHIFMDRVYFDAEFFRDRPEIPHKKDQDGKLYCKGTDLVAWDLEQRAKRIRGMLVKTYEEFLEKKDRLACPRCGQREWDID